MPSSAFFHAAAAAGLAGAASLPLDTTSSLSRLAPGCVRQPPCFRHSAPCALQAAGVAGDAAGQAPGAKQRAGGRERNAAAEDGEAALCLRGAMAFPARAFRPIRRGQEESDTLTMDAGAKSRWASTRLAHRHYAPCAGDQARRRRLMPRPSRAMPNSAIALGSGTKNTLAAPEMTELVPLRLMGWVLLKLPSMVSCV